ncbi:MAG TPA: LptF/LptG family permease [Planctomycetota bacterium]|nr:LptF/LptG family permease [Planctomycetota bacterium]
MKLLDRYLLSIFGTAFTLVTLTFLALFTAMDLSSRIARILSLKNINTLGFLAHYYFVRLPMFLHLVLPAVSLFASMFTVIQLQKTNELLPMITSGVSLRRLSLIFITGALACTLAMAVLDEFVLPALMEPIGETDDILISDKPQRNQLYTGENLVINLDEINNVTKVYKGITLTRYLGSTGLRDHIVQAETMTWNPVEKYWKLEKGWITPFLNGQYIFEMSPGQQAPRVKRDPIPAEGYRLDPPPTPEEFKKRYSFSGRSYRFAELMTLVNKFPHIATYQMHWHLKFASPMGPLVLLFLGLPFVSGAQHRSFYRGVALCLLLTIAYYAATFVCFELGIRGALDARVAVWGPLGCFGLAGLVSFFRMRS